MRVADIPSHTAEVIVRRSWDPFYGPGWPTEGDLKVATKNGGWLIRETRRWWKKVSVVNQGASGNTVMFRQVNSLVNTVTKEVWREKASTKGWGVSVSPEVKFEAKGVGVGGSVGEVNYHQSDTVTNHSGYSSAQACGSSSWVDITAANLPSNTSAALWIAYEAKVWTNPQRNKILFRTLALPTGEYAVSEHPPR
jgi:hypothetical protein